MSRSTPIPASLVALACLVLSSTRAPAASSDLCLPETVQPTGAWVELTGPPVFLLGNWYVRGIWNVGIAGDHFTASNLSWEILHSQRQGGVFRFIIRSGTDFRAQYYLVADDGGDPSQQACLVDQNTSGVVSDQVAAETAPLAPLWDVLAPVNADPWSDVALPVGLMGIWSGSSVGNIGVFSDHVLIGAADWTYESVEEACDVPGEGEEERVYRLIVRNGDEYRAQYFRCLHPGASVVRAGSGVVLSLDEARENRQTDWEALWTGSVSSDPGSWGSIKAVYR